MMSSVTPQRLDLPQDATRVRVRFCRGVSHRGDRRPALTLEAWVVDWVVD
jgi:hypothetical protein